MNLSSALSYVKKDYYIAYLSGGGLFGIGPMHPLEFLGDLTGLSFTDEFNEAAGESIGAEGVAALTTPDEPGSTTPRMTPKGNRHLLLRRGPEILPYVSGFYMRQYTWESLKLLVDFLDDSFLGIGEKFDNAINRHANNIKRYVLRVKNGTNKQNETPEYFDRINWHFFESCYKNTTRRLVKWLDSKIERRIEKCLYDMNVFRDILKEYLTYPDGTEPVLEDSLISVFVTALNLRTGEPAYFHHHRNPKTRKSQFCSDPGLKTHDMTCRSAAAGTVFAPYQGYVDVAAYKTPLEAVRAAKRLLGWRYNIKLVVFNTSRDDKSFDIRKVKNYLFLRQVMDGMDGPMLGTPQMLKRRQDWKDLRRELGEENIVIIDRSENEKETRRRYSKSKIGHALRIWGKDEVLRSKRMEIEDLPRCPFYDSRPEKLKKINRFGFAIAWENAMVLIDLAKRLLDNAASHGRISKRESAERKAFIDSLLEPHAANNLAPILRDWKEQSIINERQALYNKWPFLQDLQDLFQRADARHPDGSLKTTFTPLRYGSNIFAEDAMIDGTSTPEVA